MFQQKKRNQEGRFFQVLFFLRVSHGNGGARPQGGPGLMDPWAHESMGLLYVGIPSLLFPCVAVLSRGVAVLSLGVSYASQNYCRERGLLIRNRHTLFLSASLYDYIKNIRAVYMITG